jgi:hypothetical protein
MDTQVSRLTRGGGGKDGSATVLAGAIDVGPMCYDAMIS